MNNIPPCPACDRRHPERVAACPICERTLNQGVIGELGVWDGLAIPDANDPDEVSYAAFVACGCGFAGPSRATCEGAVIAWNRNAQLIRERINNGGPAQRNFERDKWVALGLLQPLEAA